MTRSVRTLAAVHLVGNGLLLLLGYYWLGVPESGAGTLLLSAFAALVLLCGTCWLHGGTFVFFREGPGAFRRMFGKLFPVIVVVLAVMAIYWLLSAWAEYSARPASGMASWLTLKLRKPVKPATTLRVFNLALWFVRWMIVPVFALPLIADIATLGWSGTREFGRLARDRRYWVITPVLLICCIWVPLQLIDWVPQFASFGMQMSSFVLRAAAGYILFTSTWLVLVFVTSRGKPVFSQPKTVPKP